MNLRQAVVSGVLAVAACSLCGCGMSNQWRTDMSAGKQALAQTPPQLGQAEKSFKSAILHAQNDHLPDAQLEPAFEALGQVLVQEGKFAEAQEYLLRCVGLAAAIRMPVEQNIALLHLLENCYEKTQAYDQALQTQTVLVTYLDAQKSPFDPEAKQAVDLQTRLKALAQSCSHPGEACCEKEHHADAVADKPLDVIRGD